MKDGERLLKVKPGSVLWVLPAAFCINLNLKVSKWDIGQIRNSEVAAQILASCMEIQTPALDDCALSSILRRSANFSSIFLCVNDDKRAFQ